MKESSRNRKLFVCTFHKVRPHKARQKKPRAERGKTGQDRTRPGATKSDKTQQDKTRQDEARRGGARQSKTCKRKTGRGRPTRVMGYTLLPRWSFWLFFKRAGALTTKSKELVYLLVSAPCAHPWALTSFEPHPLQLNFVAILLQHAVPKRSVLICLKQLYEEAV